MQVRTHSMIILKRIYYSVVATSVMLLMALFASWNSIWRNKDVDNLGWKFWEN